MTPTVSQLRAIQTTANNVLVLAGPGSGKTTTIASRVKNLLFAGADPSGIAIVTYTNAAARVVEELVGTRQPLDKEGTWTNKLGFVGTLHSFCLKHLDKHGNWPNGIRVIDDEEADEMLARSARDSGVRTTPAVMNVLKRTRRDWSAEKLLPETAPRLAVRAYYREQEMLGELDYNSILTATLRMLANQRTPRTVWDHLIVDEFQDAAWLDARIYEQANAEHRFYVGDPMQAIFGFRGGDVTEIADLSQSIHWEVHRMEENWRSGPAICSAAASLAKHATGVPTMATKPMATPMADATSRGFQNAATEALAIAQTLYSEAGTSEESPHVHFTGAIDTSKDEVMGEIGRTKLTGYAVLTRTNEVAGQIADTLESQGIPVRRLRAVETPSDWRLAMAALGLLARPISKAALRRYSIADKVPGVAFLPTGDADKMEYELMMLGVSVESTTLIQSRFTELPTTATLADLHASLALDRTSRAMEGEGAFVGTIHSAKGMEFEVVVLAGFEDEVIPGQRRGADVEEERRVAYVGMTRAKQRLVVTWSRYRQPAWSKGYEQRTPSRFISEAGLVDMAVAAECEEMVVADG